MCANLCECVPCVCRVWWKPEKYIGSPGVELTAVVRQVTWVWGTELWSSAKAVGSQNHWAYLFNHHRLENFTTETLSRIAADRELCVLLRKAAAGEAADGGVQPWNARREWTLILMRHVTAHCVKYQRHTEKIFHALGWLDNFRANSTAANAI